MVEARRIRLAFLLPLSREVVVALEVGACNWRRSGRRSWTRREEGLWHTERIILLFWYTRLLKRREGFPVAIQYREGRLERGYKGLISGLLSLACAGMVASRSGATCVRRRRREGTNTLFYILVSKFGKSFGKECIWVDLGRLRRHFLTSQEDVSLSRHWSGGAAPFSEKRDDTVHAQIASPPAG